MPIVDEKQLLARQQSLQQQTSRNRDSEPFPINSFQLPDIGADDSEPPPYGAHYDHLQFCQPGFEAGAAVRGDGCIDININTKNRRLAELLAPMFQSQVSAETESNLPFPPDYVPPNLGGQHGQPCPPRLNIVIQIVGSRGDVQPFVALGKVLKDTHGHRIRIATHPTFRNFIEENGLEFFNIGGDPTELMAFMVKNPSLMPGFDAITSGEVKRRRRGIEEILMGCWRSCIEGGNGLGPPQPRSKGSPLDANEDPFIADAIIANPPSFAHIHIAEKMRIPLHMMFTMPWSPTRQFPHPLANIQSSNADDFMTNYLSYTLVEMMTWQGLGDVINRFRQRVLNLPPLSLIWAPGLLERLKVSWTYCWSPALIPKPNDWGKHIDISGFFFLNLASTYTPDPQLEAFLSSGPPPVYIGFGSIVAEDPNTMTRMIFKAIELSGVRALVSKGWGGLAADEIGLPDNVFMLGDVPHDWLFEHVSCVVHHGGAGTTATGIKAGKPTLVVPFFGDQQFWGSMIARAKAGPEPIRHKDLTAENLAEAIQFCLLPETLHQATQLGEKIREEKGTDIGAQSFHHHIDTEKLRCSVSPTRAAVWRVRRTKVRLSSFAATVLVDEGLLEYSDLKLYHSMEYNTEDQPSDPISACVFSFITDCSGLGMAIADMPRELFKSIKMATQSKATQPQLQLQLEPAGSNEQLVLLSNEGYPVAPSNQEPSSSSIDPTSDSRIGTSHSQVSEQSVNDTSLAFSDSIFSSPSSTERPTSRSSKEQIAQSSSLNHTRRDAASRTGRAVGRIVSTGIKSPMNFTLGAAKGFRNVPRLYHDDLIRPVEKVTSLGTGIKVAGKGLGYGVFDGITGLVIQPWKGAEKEGAQGLVKGIGKGIGGFLMKPAAGICGFPAYAMQGVNAEFTNFFTRDILKHIVSSRAIQGQRESQVATPEERADVIQRWQTFKFDLKHYYVLKRKQVRTGKLPAHSQAASDSGELEAPKNGWLQSKRSLFENRKKLQTNMDSWKKGYVDVTLPEYSDGTSNPQITNWEDTEVESAIQGSAQGSSRGIVENDAVIEAAIRENITAVRYSAPSTGSIDTSTMDMTIFDDEVYQITDEDYQYLIEKAIQESLGAQLHLVQKAGSAELDLMDTKLTHPYPGSNEESDAELQRAIEESRNSYLVQPPHLDETQELLHVISASEEMSQRKMSQRTEDGILMEYVKKQSLAEAEYSQQRMNGNEKSTVDIDTQIGK
ncbi:hypothetical protein B0J13DRAFT_636314 [Dactylonectria estremocensis]|uniref:Glycosyltransferase family 28 N-terminal domain-containing protein n=1 Tax=Dactylonectria estremocensis TaxID=1079267 RepID=A0A9P9ERQ2_9HYPO|nr:hypothetical protein B0J13DRAFT_636314 [Dactylonectria estremocensis]